MHADTLLYNGPVLSMAAGEELIECGYVAVTDGCIREVGRCGAAGPPDVSADERMDLSGNLVMPGLVNAHTHAAMTFFRGLADDLPLMDWLQNYIFPVEKDLTDERVYWGTKLACLEMIAGGTTCFCDMYLFEEATAKAADESGLRAVVGEVLYDFPSPNYGPPEEGLKYSRRMLEKWQNHERIRVAVEPHAPYTCSPDLLRQCADLAAEFDAPLISHLAETAHEVGQIGETYGVTPVQHYAQLGLLGPRFIADHAVHVTDEDIRILAEAEARIVHNPESNMKLASGTMPLQKMLSSGLTVALGTDGCGSNNNLDLFQEMDTAAKLDKLTQHDLAAVPARSIVEMATIQGARALGLETSTGSLEPGKSADLIIVDFDQPHLTPVYDYISHLVYCARGADVSHTMVGGRWLMRDRTVLALDEEEVYSEIRPIADAIRNRVAV